MRVPVSDAIFRWAVIPVSCVVACVVACVAVGTTAVSHTASAAAQQTQQPIQNPPLGPHPVVPGGPPGSGNDDDPMARHMQEQLARSRNNQRQQQMVADAAKLLDLATQLKAEVDKSNKDTLSLSVVKKADEIEKLAKSVRDKMRDGQ
jgi:type VI protein secretion system component VasF